MKDTIKNRMKAIESLVGLDEGMDIEWGLHKIDRLTKKELKKLFKSAAEIVGDTYSLSHGWNSSCCKGKGEKLIEPLIKRYF